VAKPTFLGSYINSHAATSAQSVALNLLRDESDASFSLLEDDFILVTVNNASTVDRGNGTLVPSGYTAVNASNLYANDSNDTNLQQSYKFMPATPDANVSIPGSNATTAGVVYEIRAYRGVDPADPFSGITSLTGTNTAVANPPSITPDHPDSLIVTAWAGAMAAGAQPSGVPSGYSTTTNHYRGLTLTTTTNDPGLAVADKTDWASGAFDPPAIAGFTTTNTGSWAAQSIGLKGIVSSHDLTIANIDVGSPVIDTPLFSGIHAIAVAAFAVASPVLGPPALSQVHTLPISNITVASPDLGPPAVTQTHALAIASIDIGSPVIDAPVLSEGQPPHELIVGDVTVGSPTYGPVTLNQQHTFTVANIDTASPAIGAPALGQRHSITVENYTTASPAIGPVTIQQSHSLQGVFDSVGSPDIGAPAVGQIHQLAIGNVNVGSPEIQSPIIDEIEQHNLSIANITVGSPVIGPPVLGINLSNINIALFRVLNADWEYRVLSYDNDEFVYVLSAEPETRYLTADVVTRILL